MTDPELPAAAVQAAAEVLFEHRKITDSGDPLTLEYFTERAREVLAAALPHLDGADDRALTELYQLRMTVSRLLGYEDPMPAGALRDILAGATIRLPDRW